MEKREPDGKFKKGVVQDGAGRPKGSVSEKTRIWNEIGEWFKTDGLEAYKTMLVEMMESGDTKERAFAMQRYEAMMEYFAPKLSRTEVKANVEAKVKPPINWVK